KGTGSYQWKHDGVNISGETGEYLEFDSLNYDVLGDYVCSTDAGDSRTIQITTNSVFADFFATPTSGTAPLEVTFTDSSIGSVSSWKWHFGDGDSSSTPNPTHTYSTTGNYTVSLIVSNGTTFNTETKTNYITVTEAVEDTSFWTALHPTPTTNTIFDAQFVNTTIGYACGKKGTMLKTVDGGDNWELLRTGVGVELKKLHFIDVNTGYIVGDDGTVLKTVDGGDSFSELSTADTIGTRDLFSVYFTDANTGFVGGDVYHAVIWNTTDGGNTWHETALPLDDYTDVNDIEFLSSSIGIAICEDGKIVRTTDSGASWTEVTSGTTKHLNEMYFLDANNGWAVSDDRNVIKTTNGGSSWSLVSDAGSIYDYNDVYFTDVNTGYAIINNGVYKTTDGGVNWDSKYYQYDYSLTTLDQISGSEAYSFTWGGHLLKTTDGWETNTVINSQACEIINAVDFVDIHNGIAVDGGGNIMRTTDAGENWELIDSDCSSLKDVDYLNSTDVIAVGSSGTVLKSTNSGVSWTEISTADIQSKTLYGFDAPTSSVFYAVGYDGLIVKSSDGGTSWTEQAIGDTNLYDVKFLDANTGFAVGGKYNKSKLLKTTNGGTNWNDVSCPVDEQLNSIIFVNSTKGFIVGDDGALLKTINGGTNWIDISGDIGYEDINDISFANENFGYVVGEHGAVYFTEDGGTTWNEDETFPASNYLYGVDFVDDSTGYVVGMYSSILRYREGAIPPSVAVVEEPVVVDEFILKQNYPNPFNPMTTISYDIPEATEVVINIYNIAGQKVETLLSEYKQAGKYKIIWNAGNYSSGVYFYQIKTQSFSKTKKMLLLK
ncbi:MAG: YCF48-related protein, partial [Candidatus Marinimicrobia bacterium]|nr:YCF48-related protein [Candidatus Neomarinimicrobiota bacterium]